MKWLNALLGNKESVSTPTTTTQQPQTRLEPFDSLIDSLRNESLHDAADALNHTLRIDKYTDDQAFVYHFASMIDNVRGTYGMKMSSQTLELLQQSLVVLQGMNKGRHSVL